MENKDMWYSPNRLLSHNAFLNICLSPRGNGKTYSTFPWFPGWNLPR